MKRAIWILAALLVLYAMAYFSLVQWDSRETSTFPTHEVFERYHFGGEFSKTLFAQMHEADVRLIRQHYWSGKDDGCRPFGHDIWQMMADLICPKEEDDFGLFSDD